MARRAGSASLHWGWLLVQTAGALAVLVAIAWWAIVYGQVVWNTGMPLQNTVPCLVYTSDLCSLGMALCKEWHFLGIKRYSEELLWIAAAILIGSSAIPAFVSRAK